MIGRLHGSDVNVLSKPVVGEAGIYVFLLEAVTAAPENEDFSAIIQRMNADISARSEYEVFNALKKATEIVDNRHLF